MYRKVFICGKCLKKLDLASRRFYKDICKISCGHPVFFKSNWVFDSMILKKLEKKRFLVSTDIDGDYIVVFIKGHQIEVEGLRKTHTYCLNNNTHAVRD